MRHNPHLYEIHAWPWLEGLSRRSGRPVTLGTVPDEQWDLLVRRGIDLVYLMGLWRRSPRGREIARADAALCERYSEALPGWRVRDVVGSAFCITGYEIDPHLGTLDELGLLRRHLHERGMQLVVDFIPNHVAFDHPWIEQHPERFVAGTDELYRADPTAYRAIESPSGEVRIIACATDPYFPPWLDVAQLDYSRADTRAAMLAEISRLAELADGARCDMAMLVLSDVFARTWAGRVPSEPAGQPEFWAQVRAAVPGFLLLAECYWDTEWRLQQLGFDFTYDKRLYDRLLHGPMESVRGHLRAAPDYQARSARFVENHDEPRSVKAFGSRVSAAAVTIATLPGLRFFHDGQFEGRRIRLPVQLGVDPVEPIDEALAAFYERLLRLANDALLHTGEWRLLEVREVDHTSAQLIAWRWKDEAGDLRIIVVNPSEHEAQGRVDIGGDLPEGPGDEEVGFQDLLDGRTYSWSRADLIDRGLHVLLERGQAHVFAVSRDS